MRTESPAQQRQNEDREKRGQPHRKPGSGILFGKKAQHQSHRHGQQSSFHQTDQHAVEKKRGQPLEVGQRSHGSCCASSSSARKRFSSAASMLLSSRRFSNRSSCEFLKKRPTRLRTSDSVACFRPISGS